MDTHLRAVSKAASKAERTRDEFHHTIHRAHLAGASTRTIAMAAGLSHQRVWQILRGN